MKTTQEILDFYGVEIGKTYKITRQSTKRAYDWIGKTFVVKIENGYLEIKFDQVSISPSINILDDFEYEEVKEILNAEERKYLTTVIEPFKAKLEYIKIVITGNQYEGGRTLFFGLRCNEVAHLPEMPRLGMFGNMLEYRCYTPEELGL